MFFFLSGFLLGFRVVGGKGQSERKESWNNRLLKQKQSRDKHGGMSLGLYRY